MTKVSILFSVQSTKIFQTKDIQMADKYEKWSKPVCYSNAKLDHFTKKLLFLANSGKAGSRFEIRRQGESQSL